MRVPFSWLLTFATLTGAPAPAGEVWWSLRPLHRPAVPPTADGCRNPVDAFVRAKLKTAGLAPAPEAGRRALIRRVTFDLIGLPPTPEDVAAFVVDSAADAYERLVERLLASPHYGERWARHWMDVVHFAETHGHDQDRIRPNAWRYRDYLIATFNADTPYARFVREQVAADVLYPNKPAATPALGFMAAGPWDESSLRDIREDSIDRTAGYYLDRDDMVSTVFATFQSLTVHCARCHDHKFDPISQAEYYGLQAVFAGVGRADRGYDTDPYVQRRRRELKATLRAVDHKDASLQARLEAPEFRREVAAWEARHTDEHARWLAAQWTDLAAHILREATNRELAALPAERFVYAAASDFAPDGGHKPSPAPRPVHVLRRGDVRQPGPLAAPGALACLPGSLDVPASAPEGDRRAALANWLTRSDNALTWRSIANRVWHHHFGRGLVDTPNDFGTMGGRPTHPELLDWLACEVRDHGSLKALHRLIVTSATYRQSSLGPAAADPNNRLLTRMNRARLDAEQVRDAVLAAAGRLDRTPGGPSDQQFSLKPGPHVTPVIDYAGFAWHRPQGHRRSVYRFVYRTLPDPFVECLDGANASQPTPVRNASVTAPQALALLNDDFILVHARSLAQLLERQSPDRGQQVVLACERVWNRPPTADERAEFAAYAGRHGLAALCRLLFNANEFLFID